MAKEDIYGRVPNKDTGDPSALKEAMSDLASSFSNKINGTVKESENSEYDPENGK